jgi:hypothetical protein
MERIFWPGQEPRWDSSSNREAPPLPDELLEGAGDLGESPLTCQMKEIA